MKKLYQCHKCEKIQMSCPYHVCPSGHVICDFCTIHNPATFNEKPKCGICKAQVCFRYHDLEAAMEDDFSREEFACKNALKGCDFAGKGAVMKEHGEECPFELRKCDLKDCQVEFFRKDMRNHIAVNHKRCSNAGRGCDFQGTEELLNSHIPKCDYTMVSCAIPNCLRTMAQSELEAHLKIFHRPCHGQGCVFKGTEKKLQEHLKMCSKRPVQCPFLLCSQNPAFGEICAHVNEHSVPWQLKNPSFLSYGLRNFFISGTWTLNLHKNMQPLGPAYMTALKGTENRNLVFFLLIICDEEQCLAFVSVKVNRNLREAMKYRYTLALKSPNDSFKWSASVTSVDEKEENPIAFYKQSLLRYSINNGEAFRGDISIKRLYAHKS